MTNLLLVAFATFLVNGGLSASASECRRLDVCRCEYEDGRGVDLNPVIDKTDSYLEAVDPFTQDHYYFHPCQDIKYLPNDGGECSSGDGYALCRLTLSTNATKKYQKLGTIKDSSFRNNENGDNFLVFNHNSIVTYFKLLCLKYDKSYIFFDKSLQATDNETNLIFFSPYACPIVIEEITKPGAGRVLLILFFIGAFTYFAIGSIVRFMYLGARGVEVIPNLEFWKDLPALVRDGAAFLRNGCRVVREPDPDSYDAI